ncbi:MAG: DUF1295 domain-containing protein [Patescibacteria group bacterium]|jgi:steroid 5-alpha reductase family enzyme
MNVLITVFLAAFALFLYMHAAFALAIIFKRNDIADVAWGPGFLVVAMAGFIVVGFHPAGILVASMVALWSLRLSFYLFARMLRTQEDGRYQRWRIAWGRYATVRAWAQVFMLQGLILLIVALPVAIITADPVGAISIVAIIGALVWTAGLIFETVADIQLRHFLVVPEHRNRVMTTGLWHYTRHPNYFGEVVSWWGIGIMALAFPYGWIALVGPALLTVLILKVSGVPLVEERYRDNAEYQEYKMVTNTFLPWSPRAQAKH